MLLFHLLLFLLHISFTSPSQASTSGPDPSHSPPPPVAAAHPIQHGLPFVVVWNMPTARCRKRYNVQLDLQEFDIVENKRQRFQGQQMTIFYRDRLGKYPYLSQEGRRVNGGLPQLGDLADHLSIATTQMSSMLQPNFTGLAVIDWEEWQPLWERNYGAKKEYRRLSKLLVRQQRPDLSNKAMTAVARQKFEEGAQMYMEGTLRLASRERPGGLWGFYGFPVCLNKRRKTDESYTGRCRRGNKKQNDRLSWLWHQSAALYPSIYLQKMLAGSKDAALMVRHTLLEALRVASVWRHKNTSSHATPVLPYARLAFIHSLSFLDKTDLMHTLGESAALGAAGVVLWGDTSFAKSKHQCNLLKNYVQTVLGPYIRSLRSDARRCSLKLCHGNGRCARQRPNSGHMFFSPKTSDPSKRKLNSSHFACQCYPGWVGPDCQSKG